MKTHPELARFETSVRSGFLNLRCKLLLLLGRHLRKRNVGYIDHPVILYRGQCHQTLKKKGREHSPELAKVHG